MSTATIADRARVICTWGGCPCEVEFSLGGERPDGEGWHAVPLCGLTLWVLPGQECKLLLARVEGPATETIWEHTGGISHARYELSRTASAPVPGVLVVPIGRRWLRVLGRTEVERGILD